MLYIFLGVFLIGAIVFSIMQWNSWLRSSLYGLFSIICTVLAGITLIFIVNCWIAYSESITIQNSETLIATEITEYNIDDFSILVKKSSAESNSEVIFYSVDGNKQSIEGDDNTIIEYYDSSAVTKLTIEKNTYYNILFFRTTTITEYKFK